MITWKYLLLDYKKNKTKKNDVKNVKIKVKKKEHTCKTGKVLCIVNT